MCLTLFTMLLLLPQLMDRPNGNTRESLEYFMYLCNL